MALKILLTLVLTTLLGACVNDLDSIRKITFKTTDPDERTTNLEVFYTDSGYARIQVFAKIAETYTKPETVIKLKDGVKINFFSENGQIISVLTALYGEIHQDKGTMFVRDSVVLYNVEKEKRLETEELHWNQKDSIIYTDKAVVIRTPESILFGQGIRTTQDFSSSDFFQPRGKIDLKNKL